MGFFYGARGLTTLQKAGRLLDRASTEDEPAVIAGCVTVMLAAALDQGTDGILEFLERAPSDGLDLTAVGRLRGDSLRRRVVELPAVATRYALQLSRSDPKVEQLHKLISWRNRLVHPAEAFQDLELLPSEDGSASFALSALELVEDPWELVRLDQAGRFHAAVTSYFSEVLEAARVLDDDWQPGGLLVPGVRH